MKFNHLNVPSHWQNYWTRYPEGHTILEALIQWVSQVDEMVDNQNTLNDNVAQFRKEIDAFIGRFDERLQDEVTYTLKDWQQSGFLDVVINEALYTKYHEMDERLTNQLLNKASKEELNALGKIELKGVYTTLNDLKAEFPEGNTGLFLVQSDGFTYRWNESNWVQVAQFQSDGLAENSVNKRIIKDFEVKGNIYTYPDDYEPNTYYEIGGRKDPIPDWGSTTLPIDGSKYSKVSLWLPHGNYGGDIGSIPIMNADKVMIKKYYANATISGSYKNVNYVTLDIPQNARFIGITVNNAANSLDAREDLILVAGETINDTTIKKRLVSLNGYDVSSKQIQSDELSENSVNKRIIKDFEVKGNIYTYPDDYEPNTYYEIGGRKDPIPDWGSTTLPIDGSKYSKVSLWLPHGKYGGDIGSISIRDVDKVMLKNYYANAPVNGQYKGVDYVTLDIPENARYIGVTVKNASGTIDAREDLILVAGDTINDTTIKKRLVSLNGYEVSSNKSKNVVWGAFGDSLTEKNLRSTTNYVDYVSNDLGVGVINYGVGGTGYARGASSNNAFHQRILNISTNLDVVTIFGSFNDLGAGLPLGTAADTDLTTMGGAINQTLDNYNSVHPTTPLGIISPTPWNSTNPKYESNQGFQYVKLLEKICKDRGLPFLNLFHSSGLRPWEEEYRQLMYSRDEGNGVHPDENGHKLFYPQIREFIKTLI